ncbi:MAG: hypothetical protein ACLP9L_10265 [Thermoguttaceae bacterium]
MMNSTTTKGENMNENEHENDLQRVETTSVPGSTPGQPGLRHYRLWFWAESFAAVDCKVENEALLADR